MFLAWPSWESSSKKKVVLDRHVRYFGFISVFA